MEIGTNTIDDLDFYEEEYDEQGKATGDYVEELDDKSWINTTYQEPSNEEEDTSSDLLDDSLEVDFLTQLLRDKGITDPTKIKFATDTDDIEERDWNSLTEEEKYNILATLESPQESPETDLDDDEINLINILRQNNLSSVDFVNRIKLEAIQEYLNNNLVNEPIYEVDSISDDDLFVIDLAARVPDISDEELLSALEKAKENPDLYARLIAGIRLEYKNLELENINNQEAIAAQLQEERFAEFSNAIYDSIDSLNEIGGLELDLEPEDKDNLAEFILGSDPAGINNFSKALNDPQTLTQMAWFALNGPQTIDNIVEYFTLEITKVRNSSYKQGFEAAKSGKKPLVVTRQKTKEPSRGLVLDINDLDLYNE